jgi:hypothetical protein
LRSILERSILERSTLERSTLERSILVTGMDPLHRCHSAADHRNAVGIKLPTGSLPLQLPHRIGKAPGLPIGPNPGKGIQNVSHSNDPGLHRDGRANQTRGIPRTIHSLMMVGNNVAKDPGFRQPVESLLSHDLIQHQHSFLDVRAHRHSQGGTTVLTPLLKDPDPNVFGYRKQIRMIGKLKYFENDFLLVETTEQERPQQIGFLIMEETADAPDLRHKLQ